VIRNLDGVVINLRTLTGSGGPIDRTIQSVQDELQSVRKVTDQLNHGRALESALANVDETTQRLRQITDKTDRTLVSALPKLNGILGDLKQLTGKLKEQPWRLIYPTTIKYPSPAASPSPVRSLLIRKSR
jgi:septation ring formation regulator EzrA